MAKKKRAKKSRGRRKPHPLSAEDNRRLHPLLDHPEHLDPNAVRTVLTGPNLARAFLEKLPADDPALVPLVVAVREAFEEKEVQKAVRRTSFRFEQQGISVPPPHKKPDPGALRSVPQQEHPFAFLSPPDGLGLRGVLFGIPRAPRGIELGVGLASDTFGIQQFAGGTFSKKKVLAARHDFLSGFPTTVETFPGHAVRILERALRANQSASGSTSYLEVRPWVLTQVPVPEAPPVYEHIPAAAVPEEPPTDSIASRLLAHELLQSWILDPDDFRSVAESIQQVKESPLALSETQQRSRIEEIKQQAMRDYFNEERRRLYRERLEEVAYMLCVLEGKDTACFALQTARSLEEPDSRLQANPFLQKITERTLLLLLGSPDREGEPPGPGEDRNEGPESPSGLILP